MPLPHVGDSNWIDSLENSSELFPIVLSLAFTLFSVLLKWSVFSVTCYHVVLMIAAPYGARGTMSITLNFINFSGTVCLAAIMSGLSLSVFCLCPLLSLCPAKLPSTCLLLSACV